MIPSRNRFHRRNQVNRVYKQGRQVRGGLISMRFVAPPDGRTKKFAVVVSKKVSKKAVVRNRIRRRVFAVLRSNLDDLPAGFQAIVTVYDDTVATMPSDELRAQVARSFKKAHDSQRT